MKTTTHKSDGERNLQLLEGKKDQASIEKAIEVQDAMRKKAGSFEGSKEIRKWRSLR